MEVKSFRASSLQEALALVRRDLGPDAAVLHTREVSGGLLRWMGAGRQIEVIATKDEVDIPSRLPPVEHLPEEPATYEPLQADHDPRAQFRRDLTAIASSGVEVGEQVSPSAPRALAQLQAQLIDEEWLSEVAQDFVGRIALHTHVGESQELPLLRAHLASLIETELPLCRPIHLSAGERRIVTLVGPTGVGKTTTIAKLAANFRLREQRSVGLITVDTYRIAAVEQLRTYAEIINVPMEVVSSPREMRDARARLAHCEVVLIDTAGRSPRDDVKLHELRAILAEARGDEVHLVLSTTASAPSLVRAAEQFAAVGTTSLLLTKLDEAHGLGNLLPVLRKAKLPVSYLTDGQNVPSDILPAERRKLARALAGLTQERSYA